MARRVSSPVFVGRRHELEIARAAVARAREGVPQIVLIGGEAGVGKTRFVGEIAGEVRASGGRVLEGAALQVGVDGLPFGAIVEALRDLPAQLPPTQLAHVLGSGRRVLGRVIAELDGADADAATPAGDATAQAQLFEHLLRLIDRLGGLAPLLLVIEDVHWADRSTLELLGFLARNLRRGAVTMLVTYRSDELHRRHSLLPFLAEQERAGRAERVTLERLNRAELTALAEAILGHPPDAALVNRLLARGQGNTFYTEELLATSRGELSGSLREVLLARLQLLTVPTQEILRVAAAGGARISPALLSAAAGIDRDAIDAALREAVGSQVLSPVEVAGTDQYVFRHALVQEAVAGELLPGERVRLHAAFANAIAASGGANPGRTAEAAYHWQAAHDLPRAFEAWIRAGIAAESVAAFAEAQADFDHALELWDRVPDANARAPFDRVELLARAAEVASIHGWSGRSLGYIRSALDLVDPTADPTRAGLLHERLGLYLGRDDQFDDAAVLEAYRTAVRMVPDHPPSGARATALAGLASWLANEERFAEAREAAEAAVAVADAAGLIEVRALSPLGMAHVALGDPDLGLATMDRAIRLAQALDDVYEVARAMAWRMSALYELGRDEDCLAECLAGEAHAVEHGQRSGWGAVDAAFAGEALMSLGRWPEASAALDRAVASDLNPSTDSVVGSRLGHLEALRGEPNSVGPDRMGDRAWLIAFNPFRGPAERALWEGRPRHAREVMRRPLEHVGNRTDVSPRYYGWACWLAIRAEADIAVAARARRRAEQLTAAEASTASILDGIRRFDQSVRDSRPAFASISSAWLALCGAEASRLAAEPLPDLWQAAATQFRQPYLLAYALMREGASRLAGRGNREQAVAVLTEAATIADLLGARPLLAAIETLVGSGRASLPAPLRGRRDLSRREREVLALVVAGRSDAEIGAELFISPKTASVHVSNIKGKLDAGSRVEIVTTAIALGLVEARAVAR